MADPVAWLQGTVLAPEGSIPIGGALVYASKTAPEPIPQQVFCDKCIKLGDEQPYVLTAPDGSFSLGVPQTGAWQLIVQKGGFRRVRQIDVALGEQTVESKLTTLPSYSYPDQGDDIPKMAVAGAGHDRIEDTLAKLGLGQVDSEGQLAENTEAFDLYKFSTSFGVPNQLLKDWAKLSQYHIVFFPCDNDWQDEFLTDSAVLDNLRKFVAAGGRLYVTDYSYDVLRRAFPDPISWLNDNGEFGSAQTLAAYDAQAVVQDPGLVEWLAVQGINDFWLKANWSIVDKINSYVAPDEDGVSATFKPTVWVSGEVPKQGTRPATISYQYGCGRALFSTYHTEGEGGLSLMAQERALLYTLLEVAVCIGEVGPLR